jgi:hypothetical protein
MGNPIQVAGGERYYDLVEVGEKEVLGYALVRLKFENA